ncbi:MAG: DUF748 domain-containing protein [Deltaproteobacteria bacterium]|nr:DUF748 domain-containing protein [Deltaproteobacteria bacterium]
MSGSRPGRGAGNRSRKKWVILFVTPVLVFILAVVLVAGFSGAIVKQRIEKHFGDRFRAEEILIGWGSIKARKIQILNQGLTVLTAQTVELRPDWLSLFHKGFSISSLEADGLVLRIEQDRTGLLILPVPVYVLQKALQQLARIGIHQLDRAVLKGTIFYQARHLSGPNELKAEEVRLEIRDLVYPHRDHPVPFTARALLSGPLASGRLDLNSSINFFREQFAFDLAGDNLSLFNEEPHGPVLQTASYRLTGSTEEVAGGRRIVADLTLSGPSVKLATDARGRLVSPFPRKKKGLSDQTPERDRPRFYLLRNLRVTDGRFLFLDGKIARPPQALEVTNWSGEMHRLSYPFQDIWADYQASGRIPGPGPPGTIEISGKMNLKTADHASRVQLRNVALLRLSPYIHKQGEARITGGTFDADMNLTIRGKTLHAPTQVVLRDLTLAPKTGASGLFVGVPRKMVLALLKDNKNRIVLNFEGQGRIDNPTFSLRENMLSRLTVGLAKRLGLSVVEIGEKVIVEGIGGTIRKLGGGAGQGR